MTPAPKGKTRKEQEAQLLLGMADHTAP